MSGCTPSDCEQLGDREVGHAERRLRDARVGERRGLRARFASRVNAGGG